VAHQRFSSGFQKEKQDSLIPSVANQMLILDKLVAFIRLKSADYKAFIGLFEKLLIDFMAMV
jgi:hypothetical protein